MLAALNANIAVCLFVVYLGESEGACMIRATTTKEAVRLGKQPIRVGKKEARQAHIFVNDNHLYDHNLMFHICCDRKEM